MFYFFVEELEPYISSFYLLGLGYICSNYLLCNKFSNCLEILILSGMICLSEVITADALLSVEPRRFRQYSLFESFFVGSTFTAFGWSSREKGITNEYGFIDHPSTGPLKFIFICLSFVGTPSKLICVMFDIGIITKLIFGVVNQLGYESYLAYHILALLSLTWFTLSICSIL